MNFTALENLLKNVIGLDVTTIGPASVERAIRERMRATGFNSPETYAQAVSGSPAELQELIETVIVPETWFFRDAGAFAALEQMVREHWLPKNPNHPLRLLSLPCSSGEEPYSIAICLQKMGLSNFQIDAMDISHRALAAARQAIFGRNSFRGSELEFRQNFFTQTASGYALGEQIKSRVQFEQGNLLADGFAANRKYDFIFCRNLLIYFDDPTRQRAFRALAEILTDNGVLFVGPSESGVAVNHGFVATRIPLSFAFWKTGNSMAASAVKPAAKIQLPPPVPAPAPKPVQRERPKSLGSFKLIKKEYSLEKARKAADAGKLEEAGRICQEHLKQFGPSAQIFFLQGLVHDASNLREEAREHYRKAIYMQPDHYEALVHLALLTQSLGDAEGARLLHDRAERANQKAKS